jgi:DHA2 family multidrug resistance protein-like MFS transporter
MNSFGPLPDDQASTAQDTLAGAISFAEQQPIAVKSQLLDTAREAFTQGIHLSAAISAVAAPAMAIWRRPPAAPHRRQRGQIRA